VRVLFDAFWWHEGPISNQMVQREFIACWVRDYPQDHVTLMVPARHRDAVREQVAPEVAVVGTVLRPHGRAAMFGLPGIARRKTVDVTIAHNFTPVSGPAVTFIHDVLFQTDPHWFTLPERAYLAPIPLTARRARYVATSSAHEADRIQRANRSLRRVIPVGIAVSSKLISAKPKRPERLPDMDGFLLTVGRLNVRKNLARTIDAALASGCVTASRPLVAVGESDGRADRLGDRVSEARQTGAVVFIDRVSDAELAWLYLHADLFVFLSLGEGYGLPPVEARCFGARVLASDLPLFRETLPDDTSFVDPADTLAIAAALHKLLDAENTIRRAQDNSPWRAAAQDWSACTRRLRDLALRASEQS
jgi:glycosyltransferase involved in cell wall biosynthesis